MDQPPADQPPEPSAPAGRGRAGHGGRDMAISLAVLLVPVAILFGLSRLLGSGTPVVVDPAPAVSQAAAAFPVLTAPGLPDGWRTISATFRAENDGKALRIGYVTPAGGAVQLIESTEGTDGLLIRELGDDPRLSGSVPIGDTNWRRYDIRNNEQALVRQDQGRTVIILGKAGPNEFTQLAGALR